MNSNTRERLLEAATDLFARHGYRGASVRLICDLARANPGAVSYHFGGKKQLYRTVLRRSAAVLSQPQITASENDEDVVPLKVTVVIGRILDRLNDNPTATRILLRDLADGGDVAVEALEPTLRSTLEALSLAIGEENTPRGLATGRALFLDLAAPLFLLTAAWPVLQRALDLDLEERRALLAAACRRTLKAHNLPELA